MATEIRVPALGESVTEATVGHWFKHVGDTVAADEPLVELETDKVTLEVPAPAAGVIAEIAAKDGDTVGVGALLGSITPNGAAAKQGDGKLVAAPTSRPEQKTSTTRPIGAGPEEPRVAAAPPRAPEPPPAPSGDRQAMPPGTAPSARKIITEANLSPAGIGGTGRDGRITKADAVAAAARPGVVPLTAPAEAAAPAQARAPRAPDDESREERVRMTRLRQTIARRLKEAQNTAAMLTTFNEVDMSKVMALRSEYRDLFEKKHGVKLGFMGFFVKACVQALKEIPAVNAEIDGTDIVYKNYYHIGVAVGTDRGLVVPVVRDADGLSLAAIEKAIADLGKRARDGVLSIEQLQGGTFTISNGGVYGSLMSTPILNAPQSGILGMHKIQERPMVVGGKIEVRPMMYLALSYDHRVVDGREAVTFLVRVKESLEDPQRLVLDL
jgi:2-oxoglutarate dehydrogenase E2 component (dihydrolipoamide succinyltransferase)